MDIFLILIVSRVSNMSSLKFKFSDISDEWDYWELEPLNLFIVEATNNLNY